MRRVRVLGFVAAVMSLLVVRGSLPATATGTVANIGTSRVGPDSVSHCGSTSPCGRCCMGLAFDRDHGTDGNGQLVLFGGTDNSGRTLGDTWTYDLTTGSWTWHDIPAGPCPRHSTRMAYDEVRREAIMFGGDGACVSPLRTLGDTWAWTGDTWSPRCLECAAVPSPRVSFAFAWDRADGYVLLFGGNGCGGYCGDTWAWDGSAWTQLCTGCVPGGQDPTTPRPRRSASMIFSSVRNGGTGEIILTAGEESKGLVGGTWRWAGTEGIDGQWRRVDGVHSPSPRTTHRMAYDENTDLIMMFGGCTAYCNYYSKAALTDDQFSLGMDSWSQDAMTKPSPRCCVGLVYASRSPFSSLGYAAGIFLFGGADQTHGGLDDLYFYTADAWCKVSRSGQACSSW
jgi:Galactose oxidase, central domain